MSKNNNFSSIQSITINPYLTRFFVQIFLSVRYTSKLYPPNFHKFESNESNMTRGPTTPAFAKRISNARGSNVSLIPKPPEAIKTVFLTLERQQKLGGFRRPLRGTSMVAKVGAAAMPVEVAAAIDVGIETQTEESAAITIHHRNARSTTVASSRDGGWDHIGMA